MHIKQIVITGFKTYKDQTIIDLEQGITVILGKNGSGKSNIHEAVQFVIGEKYANLRAEDRGRLLHVCVINCLC